MNKTVSLLQQQAKLPSSEEFSGRLLGHLFFSNTGCSPARTLLCVVGLLLRVWRRYLWRTYREHVEEKLRHFGGVHGAGSQGGSLGLALHSNAYPLGVLGC